MLKFQKKLTSSFEFLHESYICDAVGAHYVCFTIQLRETFRLRLFGARGPWAT